ncbi:MAG: hypothetical protein AB7V42_07765 [Thermoleophilia bacterium]
MGRIADAVLTMLADGPIGIDDLGDRLARTGVTRSRDPAAAVRRAVRDDPRFIQIADGRIASVARALSGVALTAVVTPEQASRGHIEVEPDLAPLVILGVGPMLPLPDGIAAGDAVSVVLEDPERRRISIRPLDSISRRGGDERAVVDAVRERLDRWSPERPWVAPPVTHLGTVATSAAAISPDVLRGPGRPLSEVLADAGFEVHLGWVGPAGTEWASLTEEEIDAVEEDVRELLAAERHGEAAVAQERLVAILARHLPERVPPARRLLARILARAGRSDEGLEWLLDAFDEGDPEDWYEAALIAYRTGEETSARRWAEGGLARCGGGSRAEVEVCLEDIAGDLDAQAAFLRLSSELGVVAPRPGSAAAVTRAVTGLSRSCLVEAMVEEVLTRIPPDDVPPLLAALAALGDDGREACLAFAAILPGEMSRLAREAAGRGARARRPGIAGLVNARATGAWATSLADAPDQQQIVVTVEKERRRVSPLVVLIDVEELGGGVKDAFFLPDMAEPRLRRELFAPMRELGLACAPVDLDWTVALIRNGLARTEEIGWPIPSASHQPVVERIERWLLRPRRDGVDRTPAP